MNLRPKSTRGIMLAVVAAMVPGTLFHALQFGPVVWLQTAWCILFALLVESIFLYGRKQPVRAGLSSLSWLVCGILMARALPLMVPVWMMLLATFTALGLVKHASGGLGCNRLNPVMAGLGVVAICFYQQLYPAPLPQAPWTLALDYQQILEQQLLLAPRLSLDSISGATPLTAGFLSDAAPYTSWLGYLAGGLLLAYIQVIRSEIPLAILVSAATLCILSGYTIQEALHNLTLGGLIFAAFFIATDPVTSPDSRAGRILYGVVIGLMTELVREFGLYADGICFAVLAANMLAPQLDTIAHSLFYPWNMSKQGSNITLHR